MQLAEALAHDAEYLALLADDERCAQEAAEEVDPERTSAWSYAFERNDEHRGEMEADDTRCGGTFSELLYGDDV